MGRIVKHGISVIAAVALAGGIWYAYQSGDGGAESVAPLITAGNGPDKVAPKDPGGLKVPHRDKEVYTRFETSSGPNKKGMAKQSATSKGAGDLPPPPPSITNPLYGKKPGEDPGGKAPTEPSKMSAGKSGVTPGGDTGGSVSKPVAKAPANTAPPRKSVSRPVPTVPRATTRSTPPTGTSSTGTNSTGAPRYVPRKGPLPRTTAGLIGPFRIQIGSYRSGDYAMRRWFQLKSRHRDLLGNLVVVIERVNLGSRGYVYRLQAGPLESRDQVLGLCHLLGKRRIACSLVRG